MKVSSNTGAEVLSYSWIDTAEALEELVDELSTATEFALDTEFHRERTYYPKLALLQIASTERLALIDPLSVDVGPLARALLSDGTVVMHAAQQDLEVLYRACGTVPARIFDTQIAAGFVGMSTPSLVTLVEKFMSRRLPKGDRLTDWLQRPLNEGQRQYAASDVAYLLELTRLLGQEIDAAGRAGWVTSECEIFRSKPQGDGDPNDAWMRIKEARHLRGQARGCARELAAWRERSARDQDRPVRFVLSDLALVGIAQKAPNTLDGLRKIRGLDGRHLKGRAGDEILDAVKRGLDLPARSADGAKVEAPIQVERRLRPAVTLVSAWISQVAREERLDPAQLATRNDIVEYLADHPQARLSSGWRRDIAGDRITGLVDGKLALAFDDGELVLVDRGPTIP